MSLLKVAAFASGRGSNLQAILHAINNGDLACEVVLVISNNRDSAVLSLAREQQIPAFHLCREQFASGEAFESRLLRVLQDAGTELIVLAGYLKKISSAIIRAYRGKILNIHPALLPSFGGKGMYGRHVHKAVLDYGCKVSGVTVHLVDEEYDSGPPVVQKCVPVEAGDTPESLAARVLTQEHRAYVEALQFFAERRVEVKGRKLLIYEKNN